MGKKIPKSRKHKKLKFVDPCYSGELPVNSKKKKLLPNEPPTQGDYQDVPRHMREVINLKNQVKAGKIKKRKKKKRKVIKDDFIMVKRDVMIEDIQGASKPLKNVPVVVKQKKNESEERFFYRLQSMANAAIAEAKVEQKYGIDLVNIDSKGNAQYTTTPKEVSQRKQELRKKYKDKEDERKKLKSDEPKFDLHKEKIDFGEVAMAPPIFTSKPRKAPASNKAGKKQLVLKNILGSDKNEEKANPKPSSTKLKYMPADKRKLIENERSRAIQMYRMLKNKKSNS